MCGISLIISKINEPISQCHITAMSERVKHRGPDGEGYFFKDNFAMGHRRLSIVDLSDAGRQPMQKGDDYIIFNGMIYNYRELRAELISYGYVFSSQTDTEVLLAACQHWGVEAFKKLNGMWAFAWYRASTNEIILCRDHFGIKPLYYTDVNGLFAVASEIKQFLDLPGFRPVLNKKTAINFLVKGWLNYSSQTFFKGVKELRGGYYMVYNLETNEQQINNWYSLPQATPPSNTEIDESKKQLRQLLGDSIQKRMRADVSIGSCLSGGIDSSSIVAYLHANKLTGENFATVTSCYSDPRYDEQVFSDEVTRHTGFRALKVFPDLNKLLDCGEMDKMLYYQDQPFGTASHYSEYQVFKTAAENDLTVMLDGQGADEYFGGYDEFFISHLHALLRDGEVGELMKNLFGRAKRRRYPVLKLIKSYYRTVLWYPMISQIKKWFSKPDYCWLSKSWKKVANENLLDFKGGNIRELSLQEMQFSSLPLQLHSEDRNSMMHSIESRLPFLDHRLVEYAMKMPCSYKIRNGISKYLLREAVPELPEMIRNRPDKMGFVAPDEPWIRENHSRFRTELEDSIKNTGMFSPVLLKRFDKFIAGKLNYEPIYFRAVALNRFMRIFGMHTQASSETKLTSQELEARQDIVPALFFSANFLC